MWTPFREPMTEKGSCFEAPLVNRGTPLFAVRQRICVEPSCSIISHGTLVTVGIIDMIHYILHVI
jgi:hypothetical protein